MTKRPAGTCTWARSASRDGGGEHEPQIDSGCGYLCDDEVANGRPIVDTPRELAGEGPCPNCGSPIEISGNTFSERMPGGGKRAPGASAIIVCGGCEKVLISNTPGKFVVVPRAVARKPNGVTQCNRPRAGICSPCDTGACSRARDARRALFR